MQKDAVTQALQPDYNVAPTKPVYAVLERAGLGQPEGPADRPDDAADPAAGPAERELRVVRWGLVPFWAKDRKIGSRMINARAETVTEKPAFRRAFAKRRCLLPADGYYEWQSQPGAAKQPVYISPTDGRPLAFAGLYELWRDPAVARPDPDSWLWTATIITTSAPDEIGVIHDRMPMIIGRDRWADWLDPTLSDVADLRALLVPAAVSGLRSYPVSARVNSVRNNGPQLIEPLAGPLGAEPVLAHRRRGSGAPDEPAGAREHEYHGTEALF